MIRAEHVGLKERALELVRKYPELSYRTIARRLNCGDLEYVGMVARAAGIARRPAHKPGEGKEERT